MTRTTTTESETYTRSMTMPARRHATLALSAAAALLVLAACGGADDAATTPATSSTSSTSSTPSPSTPSGTSPSSTTATSTSSAPVVIAPTVPEASDDAKDQFVGAVIIAMPKHDPDHDKIVRRGENVCLDILQGKDDATLLRNVGMRFIDTTGTEATADQAAAILASARETICKAA